MVEKITAKLGASAATGLPKAGEGEAGERMGGDRNCK